MKERGRRGRAWQGWMASRRRSGAEHGAARRGMPRQEALGSWTWGGERGLRPKALFAAIPALKAPVPCRSCDRDAACFPAALGTPLCSHRLLTGSFIESYFALCSPGFSGLRV